MSNMNTSAIEEAIAKNPEVWSKVGEAVERVTRSFNRFAKSVVEDLWKFFNDEEYKRMKRRQKYLRRVKFKLPK